MRFVRFVSEEIQGAYLGKGEFSIRGLQPNSPIIVRGQMHCDNGEHISSNTVYVWTKPASDERDCKQTRLPKMELGVLSVP